MTERLAHAKINLALVVGPIGPGGKHEVTTVLQRVGLADRIALEPAAETTVDGFGEDTLVRRALDALGGTFHVRIEKEIPVAAGLGGGSSDAAAALRLANETLDRPLPPERLRELATGLGADVPFFLADGPQLGEGDGSTLTPLELPQAYTVLLLLPDGEEKESTAAVYARFDERDGAAGYEARRAELLAALTAGDLAGFPPNDLATSPLAAQLHALGAFRADVSGAGPAVYGLFADERRAADAQARLGHLGRTWIVAPAW